MVHAKQFLILKTRVNLPEYEHIELGNGYILSYHDHLKVYHHPQKQILLIGLAWQTRAEKGTPIEEIEKIEPDQSGFISDQRLMEMEQSWCGRYVLVYRDRVLLDASGLFGVYYSEKGISSDATLLAAEMGMPEKIYHAGNVATWMPGPYTHYDGIFRVMPSQIYAYEKKTIISRQLLAQGCPLITNKQKLLKTFTDRFSVSLHNMRALLPDKRILIALTGGYDSRTLLALCLKAGLDISAFTLEHDHIFSGDVVVPGEIAKKLNLDYTYLERDRSAYSKEREEEYYRHIAGMVKDEDRTFYAYGQYQKIIQKYGNVVFLRSSVWSRVTEYLGREFTGEGPREDIYDHFELAEGSIERKSMQAYFAWCKENPQNGLVDSDVFFWEQREGCWLPVIEQGFDLLEDADTLQPLNCRELITMLLGFPREERMLKAHEAEITLYAWPELKDIPYGGEKLRGETPLAYVKTKLQKAWGRLRRMGLKRTIQMYIMIFSSMKSKKDLQKKHLNQKNMR